MFEPWAPINGYDVSTTGGVNPFPTPVGSPTGLGGSMGGLLQALGGVRAPAAPEAQRVATPNPGRAPLPQVAAPAPRAPTPVRGDQFMQLVQMLGNGGMAVAPQAPQMPRLSQALGFR